ncbi:MAG TPA: amino acid adenylation domain-containing protein [Longimicrobium sp.]
MLLSRWSGQEDLVVGSPIAGRTQVGTEGLIGFFVNTLALRIDLSGDPTFGELVRRVRETALGAYAHQELPFERLVEEVAPERGLSHTPLFQVMFQLQNADAGAGPAMARVRPEGADGGPATTGVRQEPLGGEIRTVRFDLELDLQEVGEELVGSLRFRTDLFDAATMERFAAQYGAALAAAVASPEERLSRLAILPDEEARQILAFGGGSARDGTGDAPVHLLFAEQAARTPNAPAILSAGESLTYAELDARAERLARRLRGLGVGIGTAVAVCLERGPGVLVALLGVWKAGGVYLPLDPGHPVERLSFLLRDSGAKLVVSDLALAGALLEQADVLLLDPSAEGDLPGGALEPGSGGGLGDLAYLIYTSGSTGTPKAVMVEHAQLTHTLRASLETLGFGAGDVVAALASTAFDISLLELVTPLLAGGAVRIIPHEVARDPETLVEAAGDVSVLHAVPALMRQVVEVVRGGRMLPSLRLLLVGGDTVPPGLLGDMREVFPDARTVVLYGPTEAAIICATHPVQGAVEGHPLGSPLPGVRLRVCGPRGELAPLGVPGELWISGGGVGRGYLCRPELTADRFISVEGERAYRTGDRARWRPDGVLEFLGRTDEQVKVRGFRIEPGEVEAALREQPGVREAVVLAREDAPGDRRLVAYVVPNAAAELPHVAESAVEQVAAWETLFDDTYAQDEGDGDPTLQLKGWNSSYTGEPIPREEMIEWVGRTVERILALRPERVLEIGCGTGLLLFRVAPRTRAYHGTDFSGVALGHVRRHLAGLPQVTLSEREADELAEFAGAGFDTVVLNSVAQYFPDVDYLLRVLEGAAAALRPGGRIFVGDVRSLRLLGAFHASVELARAPGDLSIDRLRERVRRGMAEEQELLVEPALFEALRTRIPRLGRVAVQVKRDEHDNEVSRFRYDVVLHLDVDPAGMVEPVVHPWDGEDADGLRARIAGSASALLVRGVPDARVREHVRALERISAADAPATAGGVRALSDAGPAGGIRPDVLFGLGEEIGRAIEVRPGAAGTLDVLFGPAGGVSAFPMEGEGEGERPWEAYANDPQWGRRMRVLTPALRAAVRARLPEYMLPSAFVVLEAFPVTPNGKVDRAALPAPETTGVRGGTYVAPRTPAEERMAGIWAEVLGVERVGGEDNFFDLGGHSLLATQLVSRVREAFRTELPLRAVFEAPTLAELAGRVEALVAETPGGAGAPPLVPLPRDGSPLPLSFAQERLWFIDQLEPGSTAYHMPDMLRLRGPVDPRVLERALGEVVRRHETLRTTFGETEGVPFQVVHPAGAARLEVSDLSGLAPAEREAEARRLAREEAQRLFDLRRGPLLRAHLLRLGEDDHVLLLVMHHIVSDGWSMGVLARELGALREAFARGEASPLPEPPVQYADYAVWQRARLAGEAMERQLAYWRERLAGAPELLELPTDRPRPPVQTYRGATVPVELSLDLLERLQALGRSEGTTLFMTLLGAFQVLLGKYAGSEDVVVGSPIAGRTHREVEELIGFFVNMLVLRTDLGGDPTFREVLGRVRDVTLGAYEHQAVPFEKLVAELQPERSLSHSPLFQVMFQLQNAEGGGDALRGPNERGVEAELTSTKFDLALDVSATPRGLSGGLTYRTDLFQPGTIRRMVRHLERVLEQVGAHADVRISRLDLLGDAERSRVLDEWNRTERPYPRGVCIHELFDAQVRERPGAAALVWGEESLTYRELDARANRLAHHLVRLGVGPEARVGVLLARSAELIVSLLAVLKAGGCYVPLDPAYPPERLALMLADAGASVLVTRGALASGLEAPRAAVVDLDVLAGALAAEPDDPPRSGASPENLAYIVYTSGSTGKPKGVMVAHRHVVQLVCETDYVRFAPGDRVAQASNASFDALTFEAWGALLNGATLVGIGRDVLLSPRALREFLRRNGITTLYQTTALLNQLSREQPDIFAPLREVLFGGQAADAESVRRVLASGKPKRLLHMYGPTETTAWCSWEAVEHLDDDALTVSVGRPTGNQRIYLLDSALQPVPVGVPGEAWVGGDGVVRGYLDRRALTAERFVPDPFTAQPGARMYRTGDRLRWTADGALEFLGRLDAQVKIRGFRIEPGEVESMLSALAGVREARVVVREDAPGEVRLVAYVVGGVDAEALREQLRRSLPEYMVPAAIVVLESLPLTPSGKLDRKALPAPEYAADAERYEAPRTPTEEVLAGIWAEVLRLERVGVHDGFFDLGGHSLLATRVVSRVRELFGVELPLRALFEGPTVAELAVRVEELRRAELPVLPPVVPAGRTAPLPLSFAQERLWFIDRLEPGSTAYNLPRSMRLGGALDERALERALGEIVRRHEALRTTFREVDGSPVQVIAPFGGFTLRLDDLSGLAEPAREAEVTRRATEDAMQPFDLSAGPLFRATLLRLGVEDHVLLLSMHHIVSDGWSMGVLDRELSALYEAYREGGESPLPEPAVQYADYAVWQREQLAGEVLERQLAYWKERLAGAPELLELPTDHPRPPVQTYRGAYEPVELPGELVERLRTLAQSEGATLFMVVLGAFQVLLSKYSGSEDVVVGSAIAGRTRKEIEELIGFFVNTLVLRTDLGGDPGFREVLRRVRDVTLGAYEHQEVPFEKLVAELQPERSLSHSPLFQVMFSLENTEGGGGDALQGLNVGGVGAELASTKFDLSLGLVATPRGLWGGLNYSTDLFERGTIVRMLGHLARVLEQVAADADVRLSRLELLSGAERARLLALGEGAAPGLPRATVDALFARAAAAAPEAVALAWDGGRMTYAELDGRANRLAHHLRRAGVAAGTRVGVFLERGLEMVVATLAALKAGGAYVPLDPAYPAERLAFMLADTAVPVLVTESPLADRLPPHAARSVRVDTDAAAIAAEPADAPVAGTNPEAAAYVMYTSGSTGRPKGVEVPHRAIVRLVRGQDYVSIDPSDVFLQLAPASFDAATLELWGPLLNGARLAIHPAGQPSVESVGRTLAEHGVTVLWLTAGLFHLVVEGRIETLRGVRQLIAGGDVLSVAHVRRVLAELPETALINGYGPTENTTFTCCHPVRAEDVERGSIPIGKPIVNTYVRVLDAGMRPVPVGVPGELYAGGAGLALGYLNQPELTAEKFVADPFAAGARLYRTGDRVRWRADGTVEFLGRVDAQVKIRGFRVEPGEVEAVLRACPGVREAAVVVREDEPGEKRLVAYVAGEAAADEVREHLRGRLPEHMLPAAFVFLDGLPLTPNGKLDRRALPAPELASAEERYVAPRTPVEEVLAEIWAEVLGLERVGAHDSFFDLGGHSLLIMRLLARIQATFDLEISIRTVFSMPTLEAMAGEIERRIYEDVATMSEFEAERLAESHPVAGA